MSLTVRFNVKKIIGLLFLGTIAFLVTWLFIVFKAKREVPVPPLYYEAFAKWAKKVSPVQSIRSENIRMLQRALSKSNYRIRPVKWYSISFKGQDPNDVILNIGAQKTFANKNAIGFKKGGLMFFATKVRYLGVPIWQGRVATSNVADVQELYKQLYSNRSISLGVETDSPLNKCSSINEACIYLMPSFPLYMAKFDPASRLYKISFAFLDKMNLNYLGEYVPAGKLLDLYTYFVQKLQGPSYLYYQVDPSSFNEAYYSPLSMSNCSNCSTVDTDLGIRPPLFQFDINKDLITNMQVTGITPIYILLPLRPKDKEINMVTGYLLPFYKVKIHGSAMVPLNKGSGNTHSTEGPRYATLGVNLYVLIPVLPSSVLKE